MQSASKMVAEQPSVGRWNKEECGKELEVGVENLPLKASYRKGLILAPREFSFGQKGMTSAVFCFVLFFVFNKSDSDFLGPHRCCFGEEHEY